MPNTTRIPLCPYYKDEKNKSISCEDTFRGFASLKKKYAWMDQYCCIDWKGCPYAAELNAMYERIDKGADMETEQMKQKITAITKELKYKATQLGRAESRIRSKDAEIKELRRKNRVLEEKSREEFKKRRKAEIELERHGEKAYTQLKELMDMYNDALCYLLSQHPDQKVVETDVKAWSKGKFYTVMRSFNDAGDMTWSLIVKEVGEDDGKSSDVQAEE